MPSLALDGKDKVADFGEFSTYAQTFTRDIRNYAISAQPDVELFVLKCIDELESRATPSATFRSTLLAFGQWIFNQHVTAAIPENRNKSAFILSISSQFPQMSGISIGEITESSSTAGRFCPDYVQFKLADGINQYQVTLWFSDKYFRTQYDEYEIFIIPPVENIAGLVNSKTNVETLMRTQSQSWAITRIQEISGTLPHTALLPFELTWHDPNDFNAVLTTVWTAVIYGAAGFDVEAVKDKIREYIADNSTYQNWNTIYPALYAETEFVFIPMWDQLALQANAMQVGIYSSMIKVATLTDYTKTFLPSGYSQSGTDIDTYLKGHLFSGVASYRSLAFTCLGNPNNKDDLTDIQDLFPDVNFALDSLSNDYGRMTVETQDLCTKFNAALDVAREFNPNDALEIGYSRMVRRGMYFLSFTYMDFNYVILTKYSFDKTMGAIA